ncbi:uncharacterized protein TrAFT101_004431 [Trichoderma asperellum]|uniref:uncharacterized protein n=1 Tax=Trichoderma asperellum TaxID=101201 RepID=UPI00332766D1|nr:hypothetical protein TrAFT101_004431 [Trichoderma asperellum]
MAPFQISTTQKAIPASPPLRRLVLKQPKAGDFSAADGGTLDILIVPDYKLVAKKIDQLESLLHLLSVEAPGANVYEFADINPSLSKPIWQFLVESGDKLVRAISEALDYSNQARPLILIAYGFGGFVIKKALHSMCEQAGGPANRTLQVTLAALQGTVFFGCPHPTESHRELWPKLNRLLEYYGKWTASYLAENYQFVAQVTDVSSKFEKTAVGSSILTVYEERDTRIKFWKKSKLLGRQLAEITLRDEKTIAVPTDYHGICKFDSTCKVYHNISMLIRNAISTLIQWPSHSTNAIIIVRNPVERVNFWNSSMSNAVSTDGMNQATPTYSSSVAFRSAFSSSFEVLVPERGFSKMPCFVRKIEFNPNFVGRSAIIEDIDKVLVPRESSSYGLRSFCLCGLGGIGKTQIAAYYAFQREDEFDAIFWIQADEETKIARGFVDIANSLDLVDGSDRGDKVVCRYKVLKWLSEPRMRAPNVVSDTCGEVKLAKWLILFDNADNIDLMRDYWPMASQGSVLVTSRDPLAMTELATRGINLSPMSPQECILLLQKQVGESPNPKSDQAAFQLARTLGNVPLAITQIATRIRRNHMTIDEYVSRQPDGSLLEELSKVSELPLKEQYKFTMATVWKFESLTSQAQSLVYAMVFMDPDGVAEFIMEQSVKIPSLPMLYYPYPGEMFIEARNELSKTSLVQRNKECRALTWHRIVQEVARDRLSQTQLQNYFQLSIYLLCEAWECANDRFNRENFKRQKCEDILPHINTTLREYTTLYEIEALPIDNACEFVKLLQEVGWYLVQSSNYATAQPIFKVTLKICKQYGNQLKRYLADTLFSYARYGEETNMDPQRVYEYCLQFHNICLELDDGSISCREDVATSHTSLAQG